MESSSAATAITPPGARHDSLSTSEFTQVSVNSYISEDNTDRVLLFSLFVPNLNRREAAPLSPLPICLGLRAPP